jgi:RNA polymerase sigma-70 factor, ECF subfamily
MPEPPGKEFGTKIEPLLDKLFRAAYRLTGNSADAEDLVQDAALRAFTKADAFFGAKSPLAWLMRVQHNLFIDGVRQKQRSPLRPLQSDHEASWAIDENADPEEHMAEAQRMELVQRASLRLTKEQRALLALRVEGYSLAEISEITGYGVDVLNARLHRARRSLAKHLKHDAVSASGRPRAGTR